MNLLLTGWNAYQPFPHLSRDSDEEANLAPACGGSSGHVWGSHVGTRHHLHPELVLRLEGSRESCGSCGKIHLVTAQSPFDAEVREALRACAGEGPWCLGQSMGSALEGVCGCVGFWCLAYHCQLPLHAEVCDLLPDLVLWRSSFVHTDCCSFFSCSLWS